MKFYIYKNCPQIKNLIDACFLVTETNSDYFVVEKPSNIIIYADIHCEYGSHKNHVLHLFSGVLEKDFVLDIPLKYIYVVISLCV